MGTRQSWLRAAGAHRFKPPENDNRVTACLPLAASGSGYFGRSTSKYLRTKRPSRPWSGPLALWFLAVAAKLAQRRGRVRWRVFCS
jgi:hypothetical protein